MGGCEGLQLVGNVCVYGVCVCVCLWRGGIGWQGGGGGPGLLMYSHIMLGSDHAAVSKMFEAQNTIFEKCSQRLAILSLPCPDIWPFSFSHFQPFFAPQQLLEEGRVALCCCREKYPLAHCRRAVVISSHGEQASQRLECSF